MWRGRNDDGMPWRKVVAILTSAPHPNQALSERVVGAGDEQKLQFIGLRSRSYDCIMMRRCIALFVLLDSAFCGGAICAANKHPKFIEEMPLPTRVTASGDFKEVAMATTQDLGLRECDSTGQVTSATRYETAVYGYGVDNGDKSLVTWPGFSFEQALGVPITVTLRNGITSQHLFRAKIDELPHLVHPGNGCDPPNLGKAGCVPIVSHLHGGRTVAGADGYPDLVTLPGQSFTYAYANDLDVLSGARMNWIHDHSLGMTRLNVFAGLAQAYLLRDANEKERMTSAGAACALKQARTTLLGTLGDNYACEMELIIQDRDFTASGQFAYSPNEVAAPEAFGKYMVVNGVVWPYFKVMKTFYRLRLLNGCNSRFLMLQLVKQCPGKADTLVPMYKVGDSSGFSNAVTRYPVSGTASVGRKVFDDYLLLGNGERADVFVSFAEHYDLFNLCTFTLTNSASKPFTIEDPFGSASEDSAVNKKADGVVMQFRFSGNAWLQLPSYLPAAIAHGSTYFRDKVGAFKETTATSIRKVILSEGANMDGGFASKLGAFVGDKVVEGLEWCDAKYQITETPIVGTTEEWRIYNLTPDTHPIHLHLVELEVVNRCPLVYKADGTPDYQNTPTTGAHCLGPRSGEKGPRDTVIAYEGYVTRIKATFSKTGLYVWHCHIIEHEDNEMMRPLCVQRAAGTAGIDCPLYWSNCKEQNPKFPNAPKARRMLRANDTMSAFV